MSSPSGPETEPGSKVRDCDHLSRSGQGGVPTAPLPASTTISVREPPIRAHVRPGSPREQRESEASARVVCIRASRPRDGATSCPSDTASRPSHGVGFRDRPRVQDEAGHEAERPPHCESPLPGVGERVPPPAWALLLRCHPQGSGHRPERPDDTAARAAPAGQTGPAGSATRAVVRVRDS